MSPLYFELDDLPIYFDVSDNLPVWETLLSDYGDYVGFNCLWSAAKDFSEMPHFGNIYQELVINRLVHYLCYELGIREDSALLDICIDINAVATSFSINGTSIQSKNDWIEIRDKLERQVGDPDLLN